MNIIIDIIISIILNILFMLLLVYLKELNSISYIFGAVYLGVYLIIINVLHN